MERDSSRLIQLFIDGEIEGLDIKCANSPLGSRRQGQDQAYRLQVTVSPYMSYASQAVPGFQIMPGGQQLSQSLAR